MSARVCKKVWNSARECKRVSFSAWERMWDACVAVCSSVLAACCSVVVCCFCMECQNRVSASVCWSTLQHVVCVTWLIRIWCDLPTRDMTHSNVTSTSSYVTRLIRMCDMTPLHMIRLIRMWYNSSTCWILRLYVTHPSSYVKYRIHLIHMCDMTHSYVWHDSFKYDMTH